MNESPAPTVSTTSTGTPGRLTGPLAAPTARAPSPPRVTTTSAGPWPSQAAATSSTVLPGSSHATSSSLAFTRSATASSSCTTASTSSRGPISRCRTFGSNDTVAVARGARGEPAQRGTARWRGDTE